MSFVCACDFCQNDCEDEKDFAFYEKTNKVYNFKRQNPGVSEFSLFCLGFVFETIVNYGLEA